MTPKEAYYNKRGVIGYGETVENYIKELEQQKAELIEILREFVNCEALYSHYMYDDAIKLLNKYKDGN